MQQDTFLLGLLGVIVTYIVTNYFKGNASKQDVKEIAEGVMKDREKDVYSNAMENAITRGNAPLVEAMSTLTSQMISFEKDMERIPQLIIQVVNKEILNHEKQFHLMKGRDPMSKLNREVVEDGNNR